MGKAVNHIYLAPGTYKVNLTVIDARGKSNSTTRNILVKKPEELGIKIVKPRRGLYFRDRKILPLLARTIILGPITIEADVLNATNARVWFYINDKEKAVDDTRPYTYTFDERFFGKCTIRVVVKDILGRFATDSIDVLILSCGEAPFKYGYLEGKVYRYGSLLKRGIAGATVIVEEAGKSVKTGRLPWNKGRFFIALKPGKYTLKIYALGYGIRIVPDVVITKNHITRKYIALNRTSIGYLKGKVYDADSILKRGIAGARILIKEIGFCVRTSNLPRGRFNIPINPGTYTMEIEAKGYAKKVVSVSILPGETKTIEIPLNRAGILYGKVIKAGRLIFKGIAGADIMAINNLTGKIYFTRSGLFGRYSIELPPGDYTIHVTARCCKSWVGYATVEPGKRSRLVIRMSK